MKCFFNKEDLTRRSLLFGLYAAFLLAAPVNHALASSGEGGDGANNREDDIDYKTPYSWRAALRVSRKTVKLIVTDPKRRVVRIEGFSDHMSMLIWNMLDSRRSRTKRLLKDMRKLTGKNARDARLLLELREARSSRKELKGDLENARQSGASQAVIDELETQIEKEEIFINGVEGWRAHPEQGPNP